MPGPNHQNTATAAPCNKGGRGGGQENALPTKENQPPPWLDILIADRLKCSTQRRRRRWIAVMGAKTDLRDDTRHTPVYCGQTQQQQQQCHGGSGAVLASRRFKIYFRPDVSQNGNRLDRATDPSDPLKVAKDLDDICLPCYVVQLSKSPKDRNLRRLHPDQLTPSAMATDTFRQPTVLTPITLQVEAAAHRLRHLYSIGVP